jgi:hypothetical protein
MSFNIRYLPPKKLPLLSAEYIPLTCPSTLEGEEKTNSADSDVSGSGFNNSFSLHEEIARLSVIAKQLTLNMYSFIALLFMIFIVMFLMV